jgi:hypothetical protein
MNEQLFSDDEGPDGLQLTINEHYAKAFEYKKEREELERRECFCIFLQHNYFYFYLVKAKYGSDYTSDSGLSTDSESAESEDEDGEELTPTVDAAILRTLARIKGRDPAIYDSSKNIFGGSSSCLISVTRILIYISEEQGKIASKSLSTKGPSKSRDKVCSKQYQVARAILTVLYSPSPLLSARQNLTRCFMAHVQLLLKTTSPLQ